MIGFLSGIPEIIQDKILIKTGGVGYEVAVGINSLSRIQTRATVDLYIHTHVKEEALELFGFLTLDERSLFRLLLSVSGVGPKTALAIANTGADAIRTAVQQADVSFFTAVPRVGKKLAQKIIIDLKSKLGSLTELQLDTPVGIEQDAVAALTVLGFDEQTALRQLHSLPPGEEGETAESLIKRALKQLKK
ncbi:Holliday junction branch migration protein RuvA [Candidatus Woesebacteria bacterium]|nr:Holliday junction branch migration protein RuvA [Candidatus Woesebacteria bacterium]